MIDRHRAWLRGKLAEADDQINAAYWAFSRQARAKPPIMVVPLAYRRRAMIERILGIRRGTRG